MPLSPHQRKGCEVTVSEVLVPSGLPVNLKISCKHKRAKRAMKASLGSVTLASFMLIYYLSKAALEIINLLLMK